jgi:hypothetical protein
MTQGKAEGIGLRAKGRGFMTELRKERVIKSDNHQYTIGEHVLLFGLK